MTIELIPITSREQWLAARRQDLTASDIAAVAGVDESRTALRIYAEKKGLIGGDDDTRIMRRGRWLEASVIEALREERPTWVIRRAGVYLRDPAIRMGATPDAVATVEGVAGVVNIQCKVVSRPIFERDWIDGAPLKYQVQTLAEGMLVESALNVIAALVIDTYSADLVVVDVPRHAAAEERIRATVIGFWRDFDAGREPRPVYARDADVIAALSPEPVAGRTIDLSSDNRLPALLARRSRRKAFIKAAEEWVDAADAEIKHKVGDAEEATLPGWKLTFKSQTRKEAVIPAKTFRVLRITDKREKELAHG